MRKDLIDQYESLKRPGHNKTLQEIIHSVETELSKNLEFSIERAGKRAFLVCGKKKVSLPNKPWKDQIFKDPKTGVPFVSDGKSSVHCVVFFQSAEANAADAAAPAASSKPAQIKPMPVPLPGEDRIPESETRGHYCPKNDTVNVEER